MWDIKEKWETWTFFERIFHLNHVGYKGGWWAGYPWRETSFIWTMWDIKIGLTLLGIAAAITFIWTMWDIKFWVGSEGQSLLISFIWTMWDIKSLLFISSSSPNPTFIWTMWDIKITEAWMKYPEWSFHLNHVGYKGFHSVRSRSDTVTFIWTMWDIKYIGMLVAFGEPHAFIWTMWDIKDVDNLAKAVKDALSSEPCGI